MPETTPLIKAALNLRVGAGFDVYEMQVSKLRMSLLDLRYKKGPHFCESFMSYFEFSIVKYVI